MQSFLRILGKCSSKSKERRNLSSLDREATTLELDQVKVPPSNGKSIRLCSEMKSEKSSIAEEKESAPSHSEGNRTTLKSPPMPQGTFHQL